MIDWNDTKAASVKIAFFDSEGKQTGFKRIERPTQKTVADAYEYYGKTFVAGQWTHIRCGKDGKMFFASGETDSDNWQDSYLVCTRAEFEAYVKEKEVDKWTHTLDGRKCKIIINKPDVDEDIVVLCKEGDYQIVGHEALKPIKPTISESEAWRYCVEEDVSPGYVMSLYDVAKD